MKKILLVLLAGILLCGCGTAVETDTERYTITGRYCESTNQQSLILSDNEGAICISPATEKDLFAELENGDKIEITIAGVDETYPGQATVYECTLIQKGTEEDLDDGELQSLVDMGWEFPFTIDEADGTLAAVQGPYGSISVSIPSGWNYEICNVDDDNLMSADYGIQFSPVHADSGYIEVGYHSSFGVCGTGLEEVETMLAGDQVRIGYYDGSEAWEFVNYSGGNAGIVAIAVQNEDWSEVELNETLQILDSLIYNPDEQSRAISIYDDDSFIENLSLSVSAKNISETGATLAFQQTDDSITTELSFGENMTMEKKTESGWKEVVVVVDGDYAYNDVAHIIKVNDTTEYEYDWEWLYGELDAGEYRISVPVMNYRSAGDYDSEIVYAHFIIRETLINSSIST